MAAKCEVLSVAGDGVIFFGRRPNDLFESASPRRSSSNAASPHKFAYARTALKYGLKAIGCQPGESLLLPDFICESLIEPLIELGITPCYYSVDQTLQPEWNRLELLLTERTKAFLIVHYFGYPQPIKKCMDFCRKHSLMLIEDNAHGFGSTYEGQLLGTFGEVGVSAPRKSFPIKNGAFLYIANHKVMNLSALQLQPSTTSGFRGRLKHWLKRVPPVSEIMRYRKRIVEHRRRLGACAPYGSQDAFRDSPISGDYCMDESIELYLKQQDIKKIGKIRRQIYRLWQEWAENKGLIPVFPDLPPGTLPLAFPAFTESAAASCRWHERGHRAGIDIFSWPTLPQIIVNENGGAMRLWERMICFPIHQEMNVRLLEKRLTLL